jgi:phosphatidylglycerophosphatase A
MTKPPNDSRAVVGLAIATVFGVGYAPVAPGTFGSAAGLLVWWLLPAAPMAQAAAIVAIFIAGSWGGSIAERHFGRPDPGQVVIDEVMGQSPASFSFGSSM